MAADPNKPRYRQTADGLVNVVTALGTDRDKRAFNQFSYGTFQNHQQLEAAYQESWLARQVVDAPVMDATREWRKTSHVDAKEIEREEKRLRLSTRLQEAASWSRLYGGAMLVLLTGQALDRPLNVDAIGKGDLKRILVVDRFFCAGQDYNYIDPLADNYLLPEFYTIYGGTQRIHHSHVVRMDGAKLPLRLKQMNDGWGDSALRQCMEDLKDAISAKAGIATLIQEANVDIIKNSKLESLLGSGEDDRIVERYRMFGMLKSTQRMGLLVGDEEYSRHAASFGGLGDILDTMMVWVAGAAKIPMTRLFGVQSKGMGDSGEGDNRNYNNTLRSYQESDLREALERIDEVLVRSALGEMPDDYEFEFNPLTPPDGSEIAQQELARAQADSQRLEQRVMSISEVMRLRQDDLGISDERIEAQEKLDEENRNGEQDGFGNDPFGAFGGDEPDAAGQAQEPEADPSLQ